MCIYVPYKRIMNAYKCDEELLGKQQPWPSVCFSLEHSDEVLEDMPFLSQLKHSYHQLVAQLESRESVYNFLSGMGMLDVTDFLYTGRSRAGMIRDRKLMKTSNIADPVVIRINGRDYKFVDRHRTWNIS